MIPPITPTIRTIPEPAGAEGVIDDFPMQLTDHTAPFTQVGTLTNQYPGWGPFRVFPGGMGATKPIYAAIEQGVRYDTVEAARTAIQQQIRDEQGGDWLARGSFAIIDAGKGAAIAARMGMGPGFAVSLGGTVDGSFVSRYLDKVADRALDPAYYWAGARDEGRRGAVHVERTDPRLLEIWGSEYHVAFAGGKDRTKSAPNA